jgi:hypothetical protein
VYQVDPASTQLAIYVYRGGKLSRLGHNHVMTSQDVTGRVWVHPEFPRSGFDHRSPWRNSWSTIRRGATGSDFPPDIPQSDKDGAQSMLGRVLDGGSYPEVAAPRRSAARPKRRS